MSWIYYLTFIFLTAFAFLNMVIGIVVSVIEKENAKEAAEHSTEPSRSDLHAEIQELKQMIAELSQSQKGQA